MSIDILVIVKSTKETPFEDYNDLASSDAAGYWPCSGTFDHVYSVNSNSHFDYGLATYCSIAASSCYVSGVYMKENGGTTYAGFGKGGLSANEDLTISDRVVD